MEINDKKILLSPQVQVIKMRFNQDCEQTWSETDVRNLIGEVDELKCLCENLLYEISQWRVVHAAGIEFESE